MKTDTIKRLHDAFRKAIADAGSMNQLSLKTGVSQCSINRYNSGKQDLANIPFSSLIKLFPKLEVVFFPTNNSVSYSEIEVSEHLDGQDSLQKALQEAESKKHEYEKKLAELEKERHIFELEKENWKLKRDLEEARDAEMKRGMRSPFSRQ